MLADHRAGRGTDAGKAAARPVADPARAVRAGVLRYGVAFIGVIRNR